MFSLFSVQAMRRLLRRNGRPLEAELPQGNRGTVEGLAQDPEFGGADAGFDRVFRREAARTRQQDVAVAKVQSTRVSLVDVVAGHRTDDAGCQFDLENVAEGFLDEENPLAVMGPVGPLSELGQPPDMGREIVRGPFADIQRCTAAATTATGQGYGDRQTQRQEERECFHRTPPGTGE
ncbi:hypothetical protein LP414_33930 [Polaromonas sp. P1(28)-13]|nr:hypothetical protein LP414_33930 [Polaromonas sp. P1(28)-13]